MAKLHENAIHAYCLTKNVIFTISQHLCSTSIGLKGLISKYLCKQTVCMSCVRKNSENQRYNNVQTDKQYKKNGELKAIAILAHCPSNFLC